MAAARSPGVAHACGHDVHTTALLGAGLALAEVHAAGLLPGRVRLLFQPAEEVMPGGASRLMNLGALDDVSRIFCLHCDPTIDVGRVGLREGPITGAADSLEIRLTGQRRPHQPAPPHRGPHLRARPRSSPSCRRCSRAASTRGPGVSVVWGRVARRAAPPTSSPTPAPSAAPSGCSTRSPGATWSSGSGSYVARSSRRTACTPTSTTSAASRRWSTTPASVALLGRAVDDRARRRGPRADRPEPRRRGLRLVPRPASRAPWAGSAPATPGRPDVRHPPGQPAHRRARHRARPPRCCATVAIDALGHRWLPA